MKSKTIEIIVNYYILDWLARPVQPKIVDDPTQPDQQMDPTRVQL